VFVVSFSGLTGKELRLTRRKLAGLGLAVITTVVIFTTLPFSPAAQPETAQAVTSYGVAGRCQCQGQGYQHPSNSLFIQRPLPIF
jgi:hypothetical protein